MNSYYQRKFPYELSEDRLSLLNDNDRAIYEYEHSIFFDETFINDTYNTFQQQLNEYNTYYNNTIDNDDDYKNITSEEKQELVEQLIKSDIQLLYKEAEIITLPLLEQVLTKDEYNQLKEQTLSNMNSFIHHILNEGTAPGKPMDYWLPDGWFGWIGRLGFGLLSTGLTGIVALFMAGRDKMAATQLQKYMNKIVELIDMGLYKKKSIFSWFSNKLGKWSGDQSRACFRNVQEIVERQICTNTIIAGKAIGLLGNDAISDVKTGNIYSGGLAMFNDKIASKIDEFII